MDKKNLIIALEKAIEKMEGNNKQVVINLLEKLNRSSNVYIHYIENRFLYWWLIDHQYMEKSIVDVIGGGR